MAFYLAIGLDVLLACYSLMLALLRHYGIEL
jgi:hypothetical protein